MGSRLHTEVSDVGGVCHVKLAGVIDEDNDLPSITSKITKSPALISTADIERINSCGVRDWVTWLGELEQRNVDVYLLECSPAIMTQVNLVNNFVGHGRIVSFYAPYFCPPPCEADKMLLIDMQEALQAQPFRAPACRCDECDRLMEFDDIESSYFAFLSNAKQPNLTPAVEEAIKRISSGDRKLLRSRSTSMPMTPLQTGGHHAVTPSGSNSGVGSGSSVTTPSSRDLKGLLTDVPFGPSGAQMPPGTMTPSSQGGGHTLLYVIAGLLTVAIGLLAYALFR